MRYSRPAIVLHWLIALLIIGSFCVGLYMADLPLSITRLKLFNYHKWTGVCIFTLVVLRTLWRAGHRPPDYPASMSKTQQLAAHGGHLALYVLMFAVPITGYLYSVAAGFPVVLFGVLPLPEFIDKNKELADVLKETHEALNWILAAIVVGHVGAALKHKLIDKDGIMERMQPFTKE